MKDLEVLLAVREGRLALADARGIAIGSGTNVAIESAGIIRVKNNPRHFQGRMGLLSLADQSSPLTHRRFARPVLHVRLHQPARSGLLQRADP